MEEDEIKNKYRLPITRNSFGSYMELLINAIFKLLPTFEGKESINHQIIYSPEIAYKHYQIQLESVLTEVTGDYYIYNDNELFLKLLAILDGMRDLKIDEHEKLRGLIFKCTQICENIKEKLNKERENKRM
jgi:hypothetical protein